MSLQIRTEAENYQIPPPSFAASRGGSHQSRVSPTPNLSLGFLKDGQEQPGNVSFRALPLPHRASAKKEDRWGGVKEAEVQRSGAPVGTSLLCARTS